MHLWSRKSGSILNFRCLSHCSSPLLHRAAEQLLKSHQGKPIYLLMTRFVTITSCVKNNKTICFSFLTRRPHIRRSEVNFASPLYLQVPRPSPLWGANKSHFMFDSNIFFFGNGFIIFHNSNVNLIVAPRKIGAPCKQIKYSWHDTPPAANQSSIPKRNKDKKKTPIVLPRLDIFTASLFFIFVLKRSLFWGHIVCWLAIL